MDYFLCFDIGGTNCKHALVSPTGEFFEYESVTTPPSYDDLISHIGEQARRHDKNIVAISAAIPGAYDHKADKVVFAPNLRTVIRRSLKADITAAANKATGRNFPVFIENDANLAALGEFYFFEERRVDSLVLLTLGTGVGGGLIYNKQLFSGAVSTFEVGHITVAADGQLCGCGKRGCLEQYCNRDALQRYYHTISGKKEGTRNIYSLAQSGDREAKAAFDKFAGYLAHGLTSITNLLVPDKIKIGGGISEMADMFFPKTKRLYDETVFPAFYNRTKIEVASLRNRAGIMGGAALCLMNIREGR